MTPAVSLTGVGPVGTVSFGAAQLGALALAAVITTWVHAWAGVGHLFATITATGITAVLAIASAVLLAGGFATIRRLTV